MLTEIACESEAACMWGENEAAPVAAVVGINPYLTQLLIWQAAAANHRSAKTFPVLMGYQNPAR